MLVSYVVCAEFNYNTAVIVCMVEVLVWLLALMIRLG